ncbi:MAG TPA: carboxypeptidase-like regulatory domain-containing protein, partial [Gemmatimonadales bacterium]|nr:carboxypeptidase-like regulatory domain-containing protein [Gemmatimonadales bacterium]
MAQNSAYDCLPPSKRAEYISRPSLPSGTISGLVVDETRQPLRAARVLAGSDGEVMTDSLGRFVLQHLPSGPSLLTVTFLAFRPLRDTIEVPVNGGLEATVTLAQALLEFTGDAFDIH